MSVVSSSQRSSLGIRLILVLVNTAVDQKLAFVEQPDTATVIRQLILAPPVTVHTNDKYKSEFLLSTEFIQFFG